MELLLLVGTTTIKRTKTSIETKHKLVNAFNNSCILYSYQAKVGLECMHSHTAACISSFIVAAPTSFPYILLTNILHTIHTIQHFEVAIYLFYA